MASYVRNICAKNGQNPLILLKVTIDNVGVPFSRHSVVWLCSTERTRLITGENMRLEQTVPTAHGDVKMLTTTSSIAETEMRN